MKKVVYTVSYGLDLLRDPEIINKDWDYVFLTNNKNLKSKKWNIQYYKSNLNDKKASRYPKILYQDFFQNYDFSLYLDARFVLRKDPQEMLEKYITPNTHISLMNHPKRNCIYNECKFCIDNKLDNDKVIKKQMQRYKKEGFPKDYGLNAGGVIIRRHNDKVSKFMKMWFNEVKEGSYRDQTSFMYIYWKLPLNINWMDFKYYYNKFK